MMLAKLYVTTPSLVDGKLRPCPSQMSTSAIASSPNCMYTSLVKELVHRVRMVLLVLCYGIWKLP